MPRKRKQAGEPVDINSIDSITESQKATLTEMGYKPYITSSGSIKWLSNDHYLYKKVKHEAPQRLFQKKMYSGQRKHSIPFKMYFRYLLENWIFLAIIALVTFILLNTNHIIDFVNRFL